MSNKGDQRRPKGALPRFLDRQQPFADHVSSGPSTPFNFYDSYGPEDQPPASGFHEGFNNDYGPGPSFWAPEREFFPGSQSPDRYRPPQMNGWQRPPTWKKPEAGPWPDRREPGREPYPGPWTRGQRDSTVATRMFEPSDNWKQSHDRPRSPPFSGPRSGFPPNNQRSDSYRASLNDGEHWASEEVEPYESIGRDHRAASFSTHSTTPDHSDRRLRGTEGEERSVTPISPRNIQNPPLGYGHSPVTTKRESPELPHIAALPRKPSLPVRVPAVPKPPSRSPPHFPSSTLPNLPHIQPHIPPPPLPPNPPLQTQPRVPPPPLPPNPPLQTQPSISFTSLPSSIPSQTQPRVPLQPAATKALGSLGLPGGLFTAPPASIPPDDKSQVLSVALEQTKPDQNRSNVITTNGKTIAARRGMNAPSFVASTLAIDAPLMFPKGDASADSDKPAPNPSDRSGKDARDDVSESDMDVSLPPTPVRAYTPSVDQRSDHAVKVKGVREESDSIRSSRSPSQLANPTSGTESGPGTALDEDNQADDSDMDMSPPASPVVKPVTSPLRGSTLLPMALNLAKVDTRPSLVIETSLLSPQLPHEVARVSTSVSPVPTTPDQAVDETGGEESDMDMSTPTSETAPSPSPFVPQSPAPSVPPQKPVDSLIDSIPPGLSKVASAPPPSDPLSLTTLPHLAVQHTPSVEQPAVSTPEDPIPLPTPIAAPQRSREASVQVSPEAFDVPKGPSSERIHVEGRELSPPVSEETLREETEGGDKDHDAPLPSSKDVSLAQQEEVPMVVDQPSDKVITEIPLSDALRMVAKLRFRHDPFTQEARIEPILISNRQLAEPDTPQAEEPARPSPEVFVQTVVRKEQQQATEGPYGGTKHSLRKRFAQHQAALAEKVSRLRKEYLALHERWMIHCAKLDDVSRASALEEAAAAACRTTRRTTAMGDAVRSDLEMEQIIASLGNEELTDANHLSAKNAAVIPDMVSVTKGRVEYVYDDTNNLVEDPHEFYKLETGIDDWTDEEKAIMVQKYATHPKQFGIIASFLPNKTPAQCVIFYNLQKNTTIDFRKAVAQYTTMGKRRRSGRGKQKGNALLADILKHDDEVGRDSTPSSGRRKRGAASTPVPPGSSVDAIDVKKAPSSRRGTAQNTPDATPDPEPAGKRPRRRVNPSAKAVAAMEQDTDEAVDEESRPAKRTRKARKKESEVDDAEEIVPPVVELKLPEPPSETPVTVRKKPAGSNSSWSPEDQNLFMKLLAQYGDDSKRISMSMPNKTTSQVAAFYRSNVTVLGLAKIAASAPKRSPTPQEKNNARLHAAATPGASTVNPALKRSENGAAPMAVSRSRSSGRMSPPPNPSGTQLSETDKRPTSAAQRDLASSIPNLPARPAPYQGGLAAAYAGMTGSPLTQGMRLPSLRIPPPRSRPSAPQAPPAPSEPSAPSAPPALPSTMRFPSSHAFPNLSPSCFTGDQRPLVRMGTRTGLLHPNGSSVVMEFSEFAPPPLWQVPPSGSQHNVPMTLETTDDLARYLEHRTRMTAGNNTDMEFMEKECL